jgi:L-2-hydroxyglutarate oxidase LhgO
MEPTVLIIGAGVLGLACGAELARGGRRVLVIERNEAPGREVSSRNSEVIHAGLYYPAGSLKARACVEGRALLYERCERFGVPHRKTGKFVVACHADELPALEDLRERASANGAGALELVEADQLARDEPRVRAAGALWSPETGIVDAHALVSSYQAELEAAGGTVVVRTRLVGLEPVPGGWRATTASGDESFDLEAPWVVNAAGLEADRVAALAGLDVDALGLRQHPCKGDYFAVAPGLGRLTQRLVYPLPVRGGLGVHVTLDLGGRFRLGPDVEWVDEPHYAVDPAKAEAFAEAARRYLPEIRAADLSPDFAGVRPKLQAPGDPFRDFEIVRGERMVSLLGIESPGLTAAGALARRVAKIVDSD